MNTQIYKLLKIYFKDLNENDFTEVREGSSTRVYKIISNNEVFYLRIAEDKDEAFTPQVLVHNELIKKGAKVPEVFAYKDFDEILGRSWMIVKEIKGQSLKSAIENLPANVVEEILFQAGKDLALIHSVSVEKFGWIKCQRNDFKGNLEGSFDTFVDFLFYKIDFHTKNLVDNGLSDVKNLDIVKLTNLAKSLFKDEKPFISHGDYDISHIYFDNNTYTGTIDFGDLRSTGKYYDMGHFSGTDPELLTYLEKGYASVEELDEDYEVKLRLMRLLLTMSKLSWIASYKPESFKDHKFIRSIEGDIKFFQQL